MKFIKDSIREIKHVVWPTREESKKYFLLVLSILVLFWLYLFIFSVVFSNWLLFIKELVNPSSIKIEKQEPVNVFTWTNSTWTIENTISTGNISTWSVSTGNISN